MLHRVVREHLETFLAEARQRGGGDGVPRFVERELREFLSCGVLASGFARFRCNQCKEERLVAFWFCPSCGGRRMAERAACTPKRHDTHRRIFAKRKEVTDEESTRSVPTLRTLCPNFSRFIQ